MKLTMFRGYPACTCLARWLPVFERELLDLGVIKRSIDIAQLVGAYKKSGGTHLPGGALDIWQHDPVTIKVGREMGCALFERFPPAFARHAHGILNGCPHNAGGRYQIVALAEGFNGLGSGGRGGRDTGPEPRKLRTFEEGIAWAQANQRRRHIDARIESLLDRIEKLKPGVRRHTLRLRVRRLRRLRARL